MRIILGLDKLPNVGMAKECSKTWTANNNVPKSIQQYLSMYLYLECISVLVQVTSVGPEMPEIPGYASKQIT